MGSDWNWDHEGYDNTPPATKEFIIHLFQRQVDNSLNTKQVMWYDPFLHGFDLQKPGHLKSIYILSSY